MQLYFYYLATNRQQQRPLLTCDTAFPGFISIPVPDRVTLDHLFFGYISSIPYAIDNLYIHDQYFGRRHSQRHR
jgi:hypothetical protein